MQQTKLLETLTREITLDQLQNYMQTMVEIRGFSHESARDTMLLMLEEVGELAKAVRKYTGLKVDTAKLETYGNLSHEIADVLIYLIVLSNTCNINLFQALREKEQKNSQRTWKTEQKTPETI